MTYNFDEIIDRHGNDATKLDERKKSFGTDDVIPLWIADMDFAVAKPILDALQAKVKQGVFGYVSRCDGYFESIVNWQFRRHGWKIDNISLLSFAVGVVPALAALVQQFAKEGESVLIQPPVYPEFYEVLENQGRNFLINRLTEREGLFYLDIADFEEQLKKGPKCFILCNPQNPTGHVWTKDELTAMAELCIKYNVPVISDEIHADLMLFGNKHIPMASLSADIYANTITCTAPSKTFNLAGMQAATVIFNNAEEQSKFNRFWHNLEIHRNNPFSLVATIAAHNHGEEWLEQLLPYIEGNMNYVADFLKNEIPKISCHLPEATYLMWLDCRQLELDDASLRKFFIEKAKLGLNSGNAFDRELSGFMRLNVACPRKILEQAMKQLRDAVNAI